MKRDFFKNKQFRNYLAYALGEMVLVVIGILIALQIDNWNTDRKEQETLDSYLNTIARNMASDLVAVNAIRAAREKTAELSYRQNYIVNKSSYDLDETAFAYRSLRLAQKLHFLDANTSGFEALKSSGNLDQLQGSDLETLLYDYYGTASRILQAEKNHNDYVRLLWMQVLTDWPENLGDWEMSTPIALSAERFEAMQPDMKQFFASNSAIALRDLALAAGPLIGDYKRLDAVGNVFISMVADGSRRFDDAAAGTLAGIYVAGEGVGYPDLIADGQIALQSYFLGTGESNNIRFKGYIPDADAAGGRVAGFDFRFMERADNSLHITYPGGVDWAGVWIFVGPLPHSQHSMDFSRYDKLVLELKGDVGGEEVLVNIEDIDDPNDGSSVRYPLQLTDQWQTYEIDLAEFHTADFSKLRNAFGFVFLQEAQSFSVRSVRYVDVD